MDNKNLFSIEAYAFIDENESGTVGMGKYQIQIDIRNKKLFFICIDEFEPIINFEFSLMDIITLLDYKENVDPCVQTKSGIWLKNAVITLEFNTKEQKKNFDTIIYKILHKFDKK